MLNSYIELFFLRMSPHFSIFYTTMIIQYPPFYNDCLFINKNTNLENSCFQGLYSVYNVHLVLSKVVFVNLLSDSFFRSLIFSLI